MEILLTGNTEFITPGWLNTAFPTEHTLVTKSSAEGDKRLKTVDLNSGRKRGSLLGQLNSSYEFDRIVYFSEFLTPHTEAEGDLDHLRRILQSCVDLHTQFLYISGPEASSSANTGKVVLARAAEELCLHYAQTGSVQVKILRSPYLYAADMHGTPSYFDSLFRQVRAGSLSFDEQPGQQAAFLCMEDLAELLERIFDSWTDKQEIFTIPDVFGLNYEQLGTVLARQNPGTKVKYGYDELWTLPPDDGILRREFAWYPRFGLLEDLPQMYAEWIADQEKENGFWKKLWLAVTGRSRLMVLLETFACWAMTGFLVRMSQSQTQFSVVDFRLLFVVLIGTIHGLYAGLLAALLASISLARAYIAEGTSLVGLFYEPSNWMAFIAYFIVGSVCGYVRLRSTDSIHFEQEENARISERLSFITRLYRDTLEDKRQFRRQIIGRQDSFGKMYAVTQQLDTMHPQELYIKTVQVMENLLKNHTIMIYRVDSSGAFARLAAACQQIMPQANRSLQLAKYEDLMAVLRSGGLWVNRELIADMPMFAYGVRQNEKVVVIITLREADAEQMSLYYQNLFRILCGLVEAALLRAFEYENAMHDENYLPGSCIMRVEPFGVRLRAANTAREDKIGTHLLLRLTGTFKNREDLYDRLNSALRESDTVGVAPDGSICLLLNQADESNMPVITARLAKRGLTVQRVELEDEMRLLTMLPAAETGASA